MRRARAWLGVVALACSSPAWAAPQDELAQTQQEIDAAKARDSALEAEAKKLETELAALQKTLVEMTRAQQLLDAELAALEEKQADLVRQQQAQQAALAAQKKRLSDMVAVALRLSRIPAESVVMMPGDSEKSMKASRALSMASGRIKEEIQLIGQQIEALKQLEAELQKSREQVEAKRDEQKRQRAKMLASLSERKALQKQLGTKRQEEKRRISQLAKKAENLQQLLASIEQERKAQSRTGGVRVKGKLRSFASAKGRIPLPVAGKLVQRYGKLRAQNETSKGIAIATRPQASVQAPFDGEVVYAGMFLNYGRLIIIRHSDDFHTLLSGLAKIDVSQGEFLLEGEPIGAMGESDAKTRLYVELRKNNQPVDPEDYLESP